MIPVPQINILVALLAGVAAFVVGHLYWSRVAPALAPGRGGPPGGGRPGPPQFAIAIITRVLVATVLGLFIAWSGATGLGGGAEVGFFAWLGTVFPLSLGQAAFERRPWQSVAIGQPEVLIGFALMGGIVGAWRQ